MELATPLLRFLGLRGERHPLCSTFESAFSRRTGQKKQRSREFVFPRRAAGFLLRDILRHDRAREQSPVQSIVVPGCEAPAPPPVDFCDKVGIALFINYNYNIFVQNSDYVEL